MWSRAFSLVALAILGGCQPAIGDECTSSADCSQGGERLCDITQPGGYCTVYGCEPGTCPEDSTCVAFGAQASTLEGCEDRNGLSRFARAFCMAECSSDGDCRSGYDCLAVGAPGNVWGAIVVDTGDTGKVCIVPPNETSLAGAMHATEVCSGTPTEGTAGSSGEGTAGSSGEGTAGDSGEGAAGGGG